MTRVNYSVLSEINMLNADDRAKQLRFDHVLMYSMSLLLTTLINILRVANIHSHRTRGSLYNFIVPSIKGSDLHTSFTAMQF